MNRTPARQTEDAGAGAAALARSLAGKADGIPISFDDLDLYQTDIFYESPHAPIAVARPRDAEDVRKLVGLAKELGLSLSSRGAGLSYSGGYIPFDDRTVIVDLTGLNRIVEVNAQDRYVTVEAGVTWTQLRDALEGTGLTPPFWGTFSGRHATVGGGLSQGAKFYGSASRGTSAETVIGLKVVLGTGELVTTGSAASIHRPSPFYRNYGPDLSGMFLADSGAFGIKVEATLQLIPAAKAIETAAFSFDEPAGLVASMSLIGAETLASECFALDPNSVRSRLVGDGVGEDLKTLQAVASSGPSRLKGLKSAVSMAVSGRRFAEKIGYLMSVVTEGRDADDARSRMARVRQIAIGNGAAETSPSVPQVMRAKPFPAVNGLLTPTGRRINWLHTVVPNSRGLECFQATEAVYAEHAGQIERHGITWGYFLTANGPSGFGVETLIHWSDEPYPLHRAFSRKAVERGLKFRPKDMEARAAVRTITSSIIERWAGLGGVHLQIGRKYPYLETRQPQTRGLVEAFKRLVDPDNVINPGNLVGHGHDQGLE